MEMVAYNIPQCTGAAIAIDTVCEMLERGWIRCCKESSGDRAYVLELIRAAKRSGSRCWPATSDERRGALGRGRRDRASLRNYDPGLFLRLFDAGLRGDREQLARVMDELRELHEALILSSPYWLAGIKYALAAWRSVRAGCCHHCRRPTRKRWPRSTPASSATTRRWTRARRCRVTKGCELLGQPPER